MFAKIKEKLVEKAFGLVFNRYDTDNCGSLDKDELTSMFNDIFQLLKLNKQLSWAQATIIMKVFDTDGNDKISKNECYEALKLGLSKVGGIGGITSLLSGKTSSGVPMDKEDPYANMPRDDEEQDYASSSKTGVKNAYVPPEDIDEEMLKALPPPGHNLKKEDILDHPPKEKKVGAKPPMP